MTRHSVTNLVKQLQAGESAAGQAIWARYFERLVRLAHRRLEGLPRRSVDEEDVAVVAFDAFLRGVARGRFERLQNRDDLWQILAMLTERRSIETLRHELAEKRGGGANRGESALEQMGGSANAGLDGFEDPSPATVEQFTLGVRMFLEKLDDELLSQVAIAKLEGATNEEIAGRIGISLRGVERKLQIIRSRWQNEVD